MPKNKVLVGVTGSVAAIKVPELVQELRKVTEVQIEVQVVCTQAAQHFFNPAHLPSDVLCHQDRDEWTWTSKGDPVLHIELRRWADVLVIAPLDANTMAKMANGFCDNLLTCVIRAWDSSRPLLYCPAMNTMMWEHPLTAQHIHTLDQLGYTQIPPVSKTLACGDVGVGAMASVETITRTVVTTIATSQIDKDHV